jgi:hypothetical protein
MLRTKEGEKNQILQFYSAHHVGAWSLVLFSWFWAWFRSWFWSWFWSWFCFLGLDSFYFLGLRLHLGPDVCLGIVFVFVFVFVFGLGLGLGLGFCFEFDLDLALVLVFVSAFVLCSLASKQSDQNEDST